MFANILSSTTVHKHHPVLEGAAAESQWRLALIKTTLWATSTHLAINLGLPPWFLKVLEKIMEGFLWSGTDLVQGGKCLVAWGCVQRPLELGGLRILDPKLFGQALIVRWLWLQLADPTAAGRRCPVLRIGQRSPSSTPLPGWS
jgi:hypothetical protein